MTKYNRQYHKSNYINVKNIIHQSKDTLGGLFDSDDDINGDTQWVDFVFISKKERIFWNAEIITTRIAFRDKIRDVAFTQLDEILGNDWHQKYPLFKEGEQTSHHSEKTWIPEEEKFIPELEGLTWPQWLNKREKELADSGKYFVNESIAIDKHYKYGRGLHIIKNVESISIDTINSFISEFLKDGERASQANEPFTFSSDSFQWDKELNASGM